MTGTNNSTKPERNGHNGHAEPCDTGNSAVDAVHAMAAAGSFTGNIVPHAWFKTIVLKNGQPDLAGITILSEILWWYKPSQDRKTRAFHKKFKADLLQKSRGEFEEKFGIDVRVTSAALRRLEKLGVIRCELRTVKMANGGKLGNALFIELLPEGLAKVSTTPLLPQEGYPITNNGNSSYQKVSQLSPASVIAMPLGCKTNTESTTESTSSPSVPRGEAARPKDKESNNNSDRKAVARNGNAAAAPSAAVAVQESASQTGAVAPAPPTTPTPTPVGDGNGTENGNSLVKAEGRSGKAAVAEAGMDESDQDDGHGQQASGIKENQHALSSNRAAGDHASRQAANDLPGVKPGATSPAAGTQVASANKAASSPTKTRAGGAADQPDATTETHPADGGEAANSKARHKAEKVVRYIWLAQTNLRAEGITRFRALRADQVEKFTTQLVDYFSDYPEYRAARVIETIILSWLSEDDSQWYASKVRDSLMNATKIFSGKDYPNLDGACSEFGYGLADRTDNDTVTCFKDAGIFDDWKKEHSKPVEQSAPRTTHPAPHAPPNENLSWPVKMARQAIREAQPKPTANNQTTPQNESFDGAHDRREREVEAERKQAETERQETLIANPEARNAAVEAPVVVQPSALRVRPSGKGQRKIISEPEPEPEFPAVPPEIEAILQDIASREKRRPLHKVSL